jgi:hypothetical protein
MVQAYTCLSAFAKRVHKLDLWNVLRPVQQNFLDLSSILRFSGSVHCCRHYYSTLRNFSHVCYIPELCVIIWSVWFSLEKLGSGYTETSPALLILNSVLFICGLSAVELMDFPHRHRAIAEISLRTGYVVNCPPEYYSKSVILLPTPQCLGGGEGIWYTRVYRKVSGLSRNEIYAYNNKHSLRSNTKGYGSKTH